VSTTKDLSVHIHLFYKDVGIYLLDRLSEVWSGNKIYLSLSKGANHNGVLLEAAEKKFDVNLAIVEDMGTDQYGFFQSFKNNADDNKYVLYLHDRTSKKKKWLDDIAELFLSRKNFEHSMKFIQEERMGIVASERWKQRVYTEEEWLFKTSPTLRGDDHQKKRKGVVLYQHTLVWLKELAKQLSFRYTKFRPDLLYGDFSAGNVFLAKKDVISAAHSCVSEGFFEKGYKEDGKIEHALERFYFYVSTCLEYTNCFWQPVEGS